MRTDRRNQNQQLQFAAFYYGVHTLEIDTRIRIARPDYAIVNTPNGLWGQITGQGTLQDVAGYHQSGIKVIGYLTAGYETIGSAGKIDRKWYSLEANLNFIANMAKADGVDGVFIDECSDYPSDSSKAYLETLTRLAHSYGLITWGNVGVAQFDDWFLTRGGFDLMHSNEDWHGQDLSQIQRKWGTRIGASGISAGYSAVDARTLTIDAWRKGLAYCYISTGYTILAPWFEEYAALLRSYSKTHSGM